MSAYESHQVKTSDGLDLVVRHYQASRNSEDGRRTIMIVHGLSEHAGRYEHVAEYMVQQGWNVVLPDQRGHGRSSGPSLHAPRFEAFCEDLQTLREYFALAPRQLGILGHSMGGLIATRDAQLHPEASSALLLFSPLLGLVKQPSPVVRVLGKMLTYVRPTFLFSTGFSSGMATSNPEAIEKREADPFVQHKISANLFFEIERSLKLAWQEQHKIDVPVKLFQAEQDHLVDASAAMDWFAQFEPNANHPTEATLVPDQLHELLNETDWQQRCDEALKWLELHVEKEPDSEETQNSQAG